jgi:hypothetical protein
MSKGFLVLFSKKNKERIFSSEEKQQQTLACQFLFAGGFRAFCNVDTISLARCATAASAGVAAVAANVPRSVASGLLDLEPGRMTWWSYQTVLFRRLS